MSPRTHRRKAREVAMQILFQRDQNPDTTDEFIRTFAAEELKFPELEKFCLRLMAGVAEHRAAIDDLLQQSAKNWSIDRMAAVDRAILRLAIYEMIYEEPPLPPRVAITEAVEIARRFSTNESARFVNGVLDGVARSIAPPSPAPIDENPTPGA